MSKHPARCVLWLGVLGLALLPIADQAQSQLHPIPTLEDQHPARKAVLLLMALDYLGTPLPSEKTQAIRDAVKKQDATAIQKLLDPHVLAVVTVNPESRVKVKRGPGEATLQQGGFTPVLLKVINEAAVTKALRIASPQALPIYAQERQRDFKKITKDEIKDRFLNVEIFDKNPMTKELSALKVEYAIALIYSSQAGKREATLAFDVGQGSQDLGFRAEVPVLFNIRPAIPVKLIINDYDGKPTTGMFIFKREVSTVTDGKKDKIVHIFPLRSKRLAPDFFFQDQVYRHSGQTVLLPPGELTMSYGRGPEYHLKQKKITVPDKGEPVIEVKLERWINPMDYGWYSGDHHIHAAGCAHYDTPTEGVFAEDMF